MPPVTARLSDIDDDIAVCRAFGHDWPSRKLRPGRKLPRGFLPRAAPGGVVEITETCAHCGKKRIKMLTGGVFDRNLLHYENPPHWKVISADEHVTPRDFAAEVFRRMNEEIAAEAARNTAAE